MEAQFSSSADGADPGAVPIKVFKYRWMILLIFGLVSVNNFMQMLQFSIIANVVSGFYSVAGYWVDMTTVVFFISYILFFYPISYLIEKYNLKITVTIATALTLLGNVLKIFASDPRHFWIIVVAQFLISIGQVQLCSLPSKLATTWFGPQEVSTACALVVLGMQLGSALGCVQSPFVVTSKDVDDIQTQLFDMFLYEAIASGCLFLLVVGFFRARPSLPPSQSQLELTVHGTSFGTFYENMGKVVMDSNFWFIVLSLGVANGVWNAFGVLINNIYLNYFPEGESDAGLIGLITIISGGCFGSIFFGIVLDKTDHFKKVSFVVLLLSALSFIFVALSLIEKSRIATFVTIPIFGFFIAPVLIIGFEYLVEATYPVPEACSASTFNAAYYLVAILATLLFETLFGHIGYLWTFVVVFAVLVGSALCVLLIRSDLKRRRANLQNGVGTRVVNDAIEVLRSTEITIAKL